MENNYRATILGSLLPWTASGANINLLPGGSNLWTFLSLFNKSGRLPDVKTFFLHVKNTNQPVSKGAI